MPPKPKFSADTKKLLDDMMVEAGLPKAEQRRLRAATEGKPVLRRRPPPNMTVAATSHLRPYDDPLAGVALNPRMTAGHSVRTQADILKSVGGSMASGHSSQILQ